MRSASTSRLPKREREAWIESCANSGSGFCEASSRLTVVSSTGEQGDEHLLDALRQHDLVQDVSKAGQLEQGLPAGGCTQRRQGRQRVVCKILQFP